MPRVLRRLNLVPWLSLRLMHCLADSRASFYQLVGWSRIVDAVASGTLYAVFLMAAWRVSNELALAAWGAWTVLAILGGLFIVGVRREMLCVLIGATLIAGAAFTSEGVTALASVGSLAVGLLLRWESREAHRVWLQKPLYLENVNVGSAKLLAGTILVLHLFVDTRPARWRPRALRSTMRQVERACKWLVAEARRFGIPLRFEHEVLKRDDIFFRDEIPRRKNDFAGREAFETFLQEQLDLTGVARSGNSEGNDRANRFLLVHVAEHFGQEAYAVPAYRTSVSRSMAIEYAVVGAWRSAAIYAHEILHLFGADDFLRSKYCDNSSARTWDECSRRFLWRSIMYDGYLPLEQVVVDDLTAQCVGWR